MCITKDMFISKLKELKEEQAEIWERLGCCCGFPYKTYSPCPSESVPVRSLSDGVGGEGWIRY